MRIAVLSDIHANPLALDAVLRDAESAGVTVHLVLGDIVDLGPDPGAVVERVRGLDCPVVVGNHDPLDERSPVSALEAIRIWSQERLTRDQRDWLASLPTEWESVLDGCALWAVHASPGSLVRPILAATCDDDLARWAGSRSFDILCCGHTHLQLIRRLGSRTIVNVGSVGMPFSAPFGGGTPTIYPWAEYAIVDVGAHRLSIDLRRVPYDFSRFERLFLQSGFMQADELLMAWVR